jgi:putative proteasome-type protease
MTYCVAYWLDSGLVFATDSRTNAGVDYISTYSKMHVLQPAPDRLFVLLAAGNLATTQAVLNRIQRDLHGQAGPSEPPPPPTPTQTSVFVEATPAGASAPGGVAPEADQLGGTGSGVPVPDPAPVAAQALGPTAAPDLLSARYLFEAADYIGRTSVAVQEQFAASLRRSGASAQASFILGGQIQGDQHGLYLIYPQGNAVMATRDTPFLQIGESKYGKPPLDFVGHCGLSLEDAARLCLISQVITHRSNLTVGPPFELALMPADTLRISRRIKLDKGAPEIKRSAEVWAGCMQEGLQRLPRFAWEEGPL